MVRPSTEADDVRWDAYVSSHPNAHRYHLSAWRRIIEFSFGHRTHSLLSTDSADRINGVLPLARVRSRLFGDFLVSLPYVNYGGPCADTEAIGRELLEAAVELARDQGVRHLEVRTETAQADGELQVRARKVAMRLPLPPTTDALWQGLGTKMRNKVKRAERENVTVRFGRADQLDAFYEVFAINMRDLGTPVYTKRLFSSVLQELPESWIGTVYLNNEPVASGFLIGFRDAIEIPWGSSLRSVNAMRANTLLYWHLLKFACEKGYRLFDFGRSTPGSGPYEFKRQWNAEPVPLNWQYWVRNGGAMPELSPDNPRYQLAVRMWQKLPVPLTRLIGPSIVRNIP